MKRSLMDNKEVVTKDSRNLNNFYLDPNNYRFVDNKGYKEISEEELLDPKIQQRTRGFIEGKHRESVKDLIDSFKANGFLEVDMIQLKDLGDKNYLVLEGNRRITALKILQEEFQRGGDIGKLNSQIFKTIPSRIHKDNDDENHRIIMGLKHISGNKKWPAINQAKLIYDYLQPYWETKNYGKKEEELYESLGISRSRLRATQRAYHFIIQYKESDYGDEFRSEKYAIFEETIKKPNIKEWLKWDDKKYKATNNINLERFFSWISTPDNGNEDNYHIEEAIISKSIEIRDLAKFIMNNHALEVMEEERSVAQGLVASGSIAKESYEKSIKSLKNSIEDLDRLQDLIENEDIEKLKKLHIKFQDILPQSTSLDILSDNVSICFEKGRNQHFDALLIESYKVFKNFKLEKLNRINIFAGFNNTGKTTLLEAIYLLTKQNNISAFFEIIKLKNKLDTLNTAYLNEYFDNDIKIQGIFNGIQTNINMQKFEALDIDKKDDYLSSYKLVSVIDGDKLENIAHTFEYNPLQRYYDKIEILCQSIFKSPYFYNRNEIVNTHYKNVQVKEFNLIIEFIAEYIDSNIEDIELTEKNDIKRFLVDSKIFPEKSVDITSYGEGLQRIFEIALSFAYCKNGVLLIDELETAIHYSLLVDFTRFIQELAIKFNVQVFITSHSKECIGAFVENGVHNEDINFYTMIREDNNQIQTITYDGESLLNELEQDLEVRGW